MQPISAVFTHGQRRKSNTDPAQLIANTYQYNQIHHQHVMEAMKARSDANKRSLSVSLSLSSSKSSNLDADTPTHAHDSELKPKTNICYNPLFTPDEAKTSPSGSKRNSLSPNPSINSSRSSNLGQETPTKAHELKTKTASNSLLTNDEEKNASSDVAKRGSMSPNRSQRSSKSSNMEGETPVTDNKVTPPQTVCEGKAGWIKKNLCCCFYKSEEQSQV